MATASDDDEEVNGTGGTDVGSLGAKKPSSVATCGLKNVSREKFVQTLELPTM